MTDLFQPKQHIVNMLCIFACHALCASAANCIFSFSDEIINSLQMPTTFLRIKNAFSHILAIFQSAHVAHAHTHTHISQYIIEKDEFNINHKLKVVQNRLHAEMISLIVYLQMYRMFVHVRHFEKAARSGQ